MSGYKLTYFDIRGKAELARLMFTYKGIDFEDNRIAFKDWPDLKPQTPFGYLPLLEFEGKTYSESLAINNFIARRFGLYGTTDADMLEIDQVLGIVQEMWKCILDWIHASGEEAKAAVQDKNSKDHFPKHLANLEKILKSREENKREFYFGNEVSYADLAVFDALDIEVPESLIKEYPFVMANRDMVKNNLKLKDYIDSRKDAPF